VTGPEFFAEALAEYEDAIVFYETREEGLGARLIQDLDEAVAMAMEFPGDDRMVIVGRLAGGVSVADPVEAGRGARPDVGVGIGSSKRLESGMLTVTRENDRQVTAHARIRVALDAEYHQGRKHRGLAMRSGRAVERRPKESSRGRSSSPGMSARSLTLLFHGGPGTGKTLVQAGPARWTDDEPTWPSPLASRRSNS
jgi:hypothetical protein